MQKGKKYLFLLALLLGITGIAYSLPGDMEDDFFMHLPMQEANVRIVSNKKLVPCGNVVGIKLYTDGLLVVGLDGFIDDTGNSVTPAMDNHLKVGDIILTMNGEKVLDIDDFVEKIDKNGSSPIKLRVCRGEEEFTVNLEAKRAQEDGMFKIGAWVRDSTAGIGTLTFYDPESMKFAALGHGIVDMDIGEVYRVSGGSIQDAQVISVKKGQRGVPGELRGMFVSGTESMGEISGNSSDGIFGKIGDTSLLPEGEAIPVGSRETAHTGEAEIQCSLDGEAVERYTIEIQKILPPQTGSSKGMVIHVTDSRLLEKTGGIIQGMSGSPILQDGKIIGAVTHVFVNDPTRGYGIFIENMVDLIQ